MSDKLLPISEAARYLGVSPKTLRRWEKNGRIFPLRTPGNQRRFPHFELERVRLGLPPVKAVSHPPPSTIHHPSSIIHPPPRIRLALIALFLLIVSPTLFFLLSQKAGEEIVVVEKTIQIVPRTLAQEELRVTDLFDFVEGKFISAKESLIAPLLKITAPAGIPPLEVASSAWVENLNVDFLDNQDGSYYLDLGNEAGTCLNCLTGIEIGSLGREDLSFPTLSSLNGVYGDLLGEIRVIGEGNISVTPSLPLNSLFLSLAQGPGSYLNADLLDGYDSSAFVKSGSVSIQQAGSGGLWADQINYISPITIGANELRVWDSGGVALGYTADPDTGGLIASGNVGIGTTGPARKLQITTSAGTGDGIRLESTGTNDGMNTEWRTTGGTRHWNIDQSGTNPDLRFFTEDSADGTGAVRMLIQETGDVGIGIGDPVKLLEVGGNPAQLLIHRTTGTSGDTAELLFKTSADLADNYIKGGIIFEDSGATSARGRLHLAVDTADDSGNVGVADAKLTIDDTGNVGIGTTNPNSQLHIDTSGTDAAIWLEAGAGPEIMRFNFDGNLRFRDEDGTAADRFTFGMETGDLTVGGNIECTNCIDTGDLKTSTGVLTGGGSGCYSVAFVMNDYSFFPNVGTSAGGTNRPYMMAYLSITTDDTVGRFQLERCDSNLEVRWRYVTASREPEIFAWFDTENQIIQTIWSSEIENPELLPTESNPRPSTWIPVQATVFDDGLTEFGKKTDAEYITRNYKFTRYEKPKNIAPDDELLTVPKERGMVLITHPDIYYGELEPCADCAAKWAEIESQQSAPSATSSADLAEYYPGERVEPGDVVSVDPTKAVSLAKSQRPYDPTILGIVSTSPGKVLGDPNFGDIKLSLSGRVPVKVTSENGPIAAGDPLTSSSIPGVAMKATKAGQIVGKALEAYNKPDPTAIGKIMVFVNVSWYDPDVYLTSTGDLLITQEASTSPPLTDNLPQENQNSNIKNQNDRLKFKIINAVGEAIQRVGVFSEAAIAHVKAGLVETQELLVEGSAYVAGNLRAGLIEAREIFVQTLTVRGKLISPVVETTGITLYDKVTKEPYCLEIENGEIVKEEGRCE